MSSILDPLVTDGTQRPVCRVIRQGDTDSVIYSYWSDAEFATPLDISAWRVSVVAVERLLCRIVDGEAGASVAGPYLPFAAPDATPAAGPADFGVTQPAPNSNSYAVRYPPDIWPWPIALPNALARRPQDPLVVVRTAVAKGEDIQRVPLLLAVRSGGLA